VICEDAGRPGRFFRGKRTLSGRHVAGMWADRDQEYITHGMNSAGPPPAAPGPCAMNCTNADEIYSFHPGGSMNILGDGSVRFVSDTVDIRVIGRLLTRGAGETVGNY
jgi:hypothetical protein